MEDNVNLHLMSGLFSGFTSTVFGQPLDLITSRMMSKSDRSTGFFDCVSKIMKHDGVFALYNGFWANSMRIGLFNIAMFVSYEQIR